MKIEKEGDIKPENEGGNGKKSNENATRKWRNGRRKQGTGQVDVND